MGFTLLDFIVFGVLAVSGLLAAMRGFTREVLSLVAWALALAAAYYASQQQQLVDLLLPYLDKPSVAQIAVSLVAFLLVLIIASIISVRVSDMVVDSAAGAIDRTLGLVYGLVRGLALVGLAYVFYSWLQPPERQEEWVKDAKSFPVVTKTKDLICGVIPLEFTDKLGVCNEALANAAPDSGVTIQPNDATQGETGESTIVPPAVSPQ
jgi:membrane protein required for colicin V production